MTSFYFLCFFTRIFINPFNFLFTLRSEVLCTLRQFSSTLTPLRCVLLHFSLRRTPESQFTTVESPSCSSFYKKFLPESTLRTSRSNKDKSCYPGPLSRLTRMRVLYQPDRTLFYRLSRYQRPSSDRDSVVFCLL